MHAVTISLKKKKQLKLGKVNQTVVRSLNVSFKVSIVSHSEYFSSPRYLNRVNM